MHQHQTGTVRVQCYYMRSTLLDCRLQLQVRLQMQLQSSGRLALRGRRLPPVGVDRRSPSRTLIGVVRSPRPG